MSLLDTSGDGTAPDDDEAEMHPTTPVEPEPATVDDDVPEGRAGPVLDVVVVAACALFVFWQLHPDLLLATTTPAGGDMGAHVWAFSTLRDSLLPDLRLSGWTPDWYAGFPVFQFYMVVPFLAMVALNTGLTGMAAVVPTVAAIAIAGRAAGASLRDRFVLGGVACIAASLIAFGVWQDHDPSFAVSAMAAGVGAATLAFVSTRGIGPRMAASGAGLLALLGVALPYGPSFKLVTVAGVVAMPVSAYLFGRLARLPRPTPALLAVATLAFLFDKNFTIYGGNIASTMAGEFAFSISLALAIVYLGVLVHGLRTGTHRATAAVLLALVGLCHLIPAFFALAATVVFLVVHVVAEAPDDGPGARRAKSRFATAGMVVCLGALVVIATEAAGPGPVAIVTSALLGVLAVLWFTRVGTRPTDDRPTDDRPTDDGAPGPGDGDVGPIGVRRLWWLLSAGTVSALLAAWWVLPFFVRRTYLNDMGWEKIAVHREGMSIWNWLSQEVGPELVPGDLRVVAALALVGGVLSVAFRNRIGVALTVLAVVFGVAFVYAPQGRLWNARLLPFWYLVLYLLAALGVGEVARAVAQVLSRDAGRPRRAVTLVAAPVAFLLLAVFLGGQLRNLPGGRANADGTYRLNNSIGIPGLFSVPVPDALAVDVGGRNFVTDWSRWNYSGYERKDAYPEYRGIVATMAEVGESRGCGRSLWEYSPDLNDYGTPMALMLLPHWTDGCIGSMEGLYFEASSTTPFHFLIQSELSNQPSRAQRDMPYRNLDMDAGVEHLQLLGVRYYLARSPEANAAARTNPDLTEIAVDGPWIVYEVADAALVEALAFEPAVTTATEHQAEWLGCQEGKDPCPGAALEWFQDPSRWDVALAASGPSRWQRIGIGETPTRRPVTPAVVEDIAWDDASISFRVDRVGTPVLVKASYFPNWQVSGADGPYRVAPNLMLVVPTSEQVTLSFARTGVDLVALALSLLGLLAAVALARRPGIVVPPLRSDAPDADVGIPTDPPEDDLGSGTTADDLGSGTTDDGPGPAWDDGVRPVAIRPDEFRPRDGRPDISLPGGDDPHG